MPTMTDAALGVLVDGFAMIAELVAIGAELDAIDARYGRSADVAAVRERHQRLCDAVLEGMRVLLCGAPI